MNNKICLLRPFTTIDPMSRDPEVVDRVADEIILSIANIILANNILQLTF